MSKETSINDINNKLSKEEDDIVNSILSELNDGDGDQQMPHHQQMPPQQMQHQQQMQHHQQMQEQMPSQQMQEQMQQQQMQEQMQMQQMQEQQMQQQQMQQQQMQPQQMQQQQMQPQQMQQQQMQPENTEPISGESDKDSFTNNLQKNIKEPIIIGFIAFILSLPQVDTMLISTGLPLIVGENGNISMFGIAFKCLSIGIIYYILKMFLNS